MGSTFAPSFTDDISIIAAGTLAKGSVARGTWDLSAKFGGRLFLDLGKGGATALSAGAAVLIRELVNAGAISRPGGRSRQQNTNTATSTTVNADSAASQKALNVASVTGFAAGDTVVIQDSGGGVTRLEFARVSKTAAGILTLDDNLLFTHTAAQADTVRNKADSFSAIWLPGGCQYEIVIDYGAEATGDNLTYRALGQSYDSVISSP